MKILFDKNVIFFFYQLKIHRYMYIYGLMTHVNRRSAMRKCAILLINAIIESF